MNYTFCNPILKDKIEILKDSEDELIFRTYLEPNAGQSKLHYHTKLTEIFKVVKGELCLYSKNNHNTYKSSETKIIKPYTSHRFYNNSNEEVIFDVKILNPNQMAKALKIMYGIARDGKTNNTGLPKNIFHLAIGLKKMNAYSPNFPESLQYFIIELLRDVGKITGIEKRLTQKYCLE